MNIAVDINRPNKSVTLILGSYDPIQWDITRQPNTDVERIILIGYGANKASVKVDGDIFDNITRNRDIDAPYQAQGDRFRHLVENIPGSFGFERFDSFHGKYNAPKDGFQITESHRDAEIYDPDYLRNHIQPISKNSQLRVFGNVAGQSGELNPEGTLAAALDLTPSFKLAVSLDQTTGYLYTPKGLRQVFADEDYTGAVGSNLIPLPPRHLRLGHFKAIALDEKRNRVLAAFQAGGAKSVIMALDLETNQWRKFGSTGRNEPHSLFYDRESDKFLISLSGFSGRISIGTMDADTGDYETLRHIKSADFDGLTDLYDVGNRGTPYIYIAGLTGNHMALATDGTDIFSRSRTTLAADPFRRIYILDLETGELNLTYYD